MLVNTKSMSIKEETWMMMVIMNIGLTSMESTKMLYLEFLMNLETTKYI